MSIVKEIHQSFDTAPIFFRTALESVVNPADASFVNDFLFTELNPSGIRAAMTSTRGLVPNPAIYQSQVDSINQYAYYHPQNKFITEKQLARICKKYNLICGPEFCFNGDIPERNQLAIDRFKVSNRLHKIGKVSSKADYHSFKLKIHRDLGLNFSTDGFGNFIHSKQIVSLITELIEIPNSENFVLPMKNGYALYVCFDGEEFTLAKALEEIKYAHEGETEYQSSGCGIFDIAGFSDTCGPIHRHEDSMRFYAIKESVVKGIAQFEYQEIDNNLIEFVYTRESTRDFDNRIYTRAEYSFNINAVTRALYEIERADFFSLNNVFKKVVAPAEMFSNTESFILDKGYQMTLNNQMGYGIQSVFIDDPIVLQPVPYGYLVVTMWGEEASIPETQNGQLN